MRDTFTQLCCRIETLLAQKGCLILAIDGCCASGKTTLAHQLAKRFSGDVIHMDDFFLTLPLRTPERLAEPGGNVHYERFLEQIIVPLQAAHRAKCNNTEGDALTDAASQKTSFPALPSLSWQRFDCSCGAFSPELQHTQGNPFLIIEGSYSMRPEFCNAYDLSLFLRIPEDIQKKRILARNGYESWLTFRDRWIPMENRYFEHYSISQQCSFTLDGTTL